MVPEVYPNTIGHSKNEIKTTFLFWKMAPRDGFEPPAKRLTVACSTAELPGNSALPSVIQNKN